MWANVKFWLAKDIAAVIGIGTFCLSLAILGTVGFFIALGLEKIQKFRGKRK